MLIDELSPVAAEMPHYLLFITPPCRYFTLGRLLLLRHATVAATPHYYAGHAPTPWIFTPPRQMP